MGFLGVSVGPESLAVSDRRFNFLYAPGSRLRWCKNPLFLDESLEMSALNSYQVQLYEARIIFNRGWKRAIHRMRSDIQSVQGL